MSLEGRRYKKEVLNAKHEIFWGGYYYCIVRSLSHHFLVGVAIFNTHFYANVMTSPMSIHCKKKDLHVWYEPVALIVHCILYWFFSHSALYKGIWHNSDLTISSSQYVMVQSMEIPVCDRLLWAVSSSKASENFVCCTVALYYNVLLPNCTT